NSADGTVAIWLLDDGGFAGGGTVAAPGTGWTVAKVGDFDADGRADLLWRGPGGAVVLWLMDGLVPKAQAGLGAVGLDWAVF
ncbi:MAG: hypothetical protein ACOYOH_24350, partial [Paracraurococcus sp.]